MNERARTWRSGLMWAGYLLIVVLLSGLVFHTAEKPLVFGKYAAIDVLWICFLLFLGLVWKRFLFFLSADSVIRGPEGKSKTVGPRGKMIYCLVLLLLLAGLVEFRLRSKAKADFTIGEFDPYLQNALATNSPLHVNALGFRGDELAPQKPAGGLRIFYLGGSTFLGASVSFEDSHPRLVEQKLKAKFPGRTIEVQNAGNHWHTTEHSIIKYLFKIKELQPDVILLCHNINDLYRSFTPEEFAAPVYRSDYSHFYGPVAHMVRAYFERATPPLFSIHLVTLDRLSDYLGRTLYSDFRTMREVEVDDFPSIEPFRRNLVSMARILKQDGVKLVLVTEPYLYRDDLTAAERKKLWMNKKMCARGRAYASAASMARGMSRFNQVIKEVASENSVPLLDMEASIPKTLEYFRDDCHYTEKGHRLVADTAFDFLVREQLVP
ncbi:MAG: GDSL-type esterase/lipase family protein [Lentisphaerota bacterium]